MSKLRSSAAKFCGVLAVAAILASAILTFAARSLFNPDIFAARVADGLGESGVARIVAARLTDQVIELRRDLMAYRPIVMATVERIVSSRAFRAVARRAIRESHARLISAGGHELTLSINDAGVIVRGALSMYPEIAEKVPSRIRVRLSDEGSWPNGKLLVAVLRSGHRIRMHAVTTLGVGLLLGVVGLVLARPRHTYLVRCGMGLTVAAFVVGLVARFGATPAAALSGSPVAAELIRGVWPAFVEPLARRMLILGAMGLVLVAAVTSSFARVIRLAYVHELWRRLSTRPERKSRALLRSAMLVTAGALVAFHPLAALQVLLIILGAALFFLGIQELFAIIGPALPPALTEVVAAAPRSRPRPLRLALLIALPLALIAAGVGMLRRDDARAVVPPIVDACNGHPELCGRRLDEAAFAATHNSMAAADSPNWMFPNQEKGIQGQLDDGVRGFLVDVHYGIPVGDRIKTFIEDEAANMVKYEETLGKEGVDAGMRIRARLVGKETGERDVYLGHGFCELGARKFTDALEETRDFLVANPGEVIIIIIQDEGVAPADIARCFEESGLAPLVYRGPAKPPWPTLGEMIALDQRVVVFAEHAVADVPWYHPVSEVFQETPYGFKSLSEFSNVPNRGGTAGSLLLMNHWIETTPTPRPSNAEIVNAFDVLYERAEDLRKKRGKMPTLVAVDFYATGDLMKVVDTLNGVAAAPAETTAALAN